MAFNTVTVTTTATEIVAPNTKRLSLIVFNSGDEVVYIGQDNTVTIANGIPLNLDSSLTEESGGTKMYCGPIYGIVGSGTSDVRYWERIR